MKRLRHIETFLFCMVILLFMIAAVITMRGYLGNIRQYTAGDRWSKEYPLEHWGDRYVEKVSTIKKIVDDCCTESFPWSSDIHDIVKIYKKNILGYNMEAISSTYEAFKYAQVPCSNVIEFANRLENEGYPFLYVQTPAKDSVVYCQGRGEDIEHLPILERSRAFVNALEKTQINVMDIAQEPRLSLSYDSSNHWSLTDGLLCAQLVAEELNNSYGFAFNIEDYDMDDYRNLMDIYPEMENAIKLNCGYTYEIPVPVKETAYAITFAEEKSWRGSFQETLIRPAEEWNLTGGAYHEVFRIDNRLIYEIHNKSSVTNRGKKALIIGDSFNWPVSAYLSTGIEDIVVIHNASFTGSLMTYIRQMQPDVVLMIYNDAEFYDIYTDDAYNLK